MSLPKVLIIGAEPYRENSSSRYLASFFGGWEADRLAQLYTVDMKPANGFCGTYFRVTDKDMVRSLLRRGEIGTVFDGAAAGETAPAPAGGKKKRSLVSVLTEHKDAPLMQLARGALWERRAWDNGRLAAWLDAFAPDLIFCAVGRKRMATIALTVAHRRNVPMITFFPDDYYFKYTQSRSAAERRYGKDLQGVVKESLAYASHNLFACELMKEAYEKEFDCRGEAMYFTSRLAAADAPRRKNTFLYCGAVEYGRWKTLLALGAALHEISAELCVDVYSDVTERIRGEMEGAPGIRLHEPVPYAEVCRMMGEYEYVLHVEDFAPENKEFTRFSLSTKIADCLSCGAVTLAVGPSDIGSMDYLLRTDAAFCCTDPARLGQELRALLPDEEKKRAIVERAKETARRNHSDAGNREKIGRLAVQAVEGAKNA